MYVLEYELNTFFAPWQEQSIYINKAGSLLTIYAIGSNILTRNVSMLAKIILKVGRKVIDAWKLKIGNDQPSFHFIGRHVYCLVIARKSVNKYGDCAKIP